MRQHKVTVLWHCAHSNPLHILLPVPSSSPDASPMPPLCALVTAPPPPPPPLPLPQDYESLPVEEFGKALLRGLGWSDGQGVGRKRQLVEPKQTVRRPERLGLGANPAAPPPEKRPHKMGEWRSCCSWVQGRYLGIRAAAAAAVSSHMRKLCLRACCTHLSGPHPHSLQAPAIDIHCCGGSQLQPCDSTSDCINASNTLTCPCPTSACDKADEDFSAAPSAADRVHVFCFLTPVFCPPLSPSLSLSHTPAGEKAHPNLPPSSLEADRLHLVFHSRVLPLTLSLTLTLTLTPQTLAGEKAREDLVAAPSADGRVRHRVGLDEALVPRARLAPGPQPGKVMEVAAGRHEGLLAAVRELLGGSGGWDHKCDAQCDVWGAWVAVGLNRADSSE